MHKNTMQDEINWNSLLLRSKEKPQTKQTGLGL
jgi:hypothetical protein